MGKERGKMNRGWITHGAGLLVLDPAFSYNSSGLSGLPKRKGNQPGCIISITNYQRHFFASLE